MQERIHSSHVDERAIIRQAAHRCADRVTFFDLPVKAILRRALFLFGQRPPIDNHVLIGDVEFDNPAADFLSDQLLHLHGFAHSAARCGHKRSHPHIHAEAALHHARDRAQHRRFFSERFLQRAPIHRAFDFESGKLVIAVQIAPFDGDQRLVAGFEGLPLQCGDRQDPF